MVRLVSNYLIVVKLAIFIPIVLIQGVKIVMKKNFLRKKMNISEKRHGKK
jgi:hypothetical protein